MRVITPEPAGEMELWPITRVRQSLAGSAVVRAVDSVRGDGGLQLALGCRLVRPLRSAEIAQLERQHNVCPEWDRLRVSDGFDPGRIHGSTFRGDVVLGIFTGETLLADSVHFPTGVYRSTIADSILGHDILVMDVTLLSHYVVADGVSLISCGTVSCDRNTAFGNGEDLVLGPETGGREVKAYAEIDPEVATQIARARSDERLQTLYRFAVDGYAARVTCSRGIIERGSSLRHISKVHNAYVGPHSRIDGAAALVNTTILSDCDTPTHIGTGALVRNSLLQWGSRADSFAVVEHSVLCEKAHVSCHVRVTHSILGPQSEMSEGEVLNSLTGPLVAAHHQSLLCSAIWPEGKGNISYGAKVGSNHTGRAPDQEILIGEGMFFGLGVNVKYPADFSAAPYTLVAAGSNLLPQRMTFPFSLIRPPAEQLPGVAPAWNELLPAWGLAENLYAVKRNEAKYRRRYHCRHSSGSLEVFRPAIIDLMSGALRRLESVPTARSVYTERDIPGLGKNYLLEERRREAISAYRFFIRHYVALGVKRRVEDLLHSHDVVELDELFTASGGNDLWQHQRRTALAALETRDSRELLGELPEQLSEIARAVQASRAKDDERGRRTIDDYDAVHDAAENDEVVRRVWEETSRLQWEVEALQHRLASEPALSAPRPL